MHATLTFEDGTVLTVTYDPQAPYPIVNDSGIAYLDGIVCTPHPWVSPCDGARHPTAEMAMREELENHLFRTDAMTFISEIQDMMTGLVIHGSAFDAKGASLS